MSSGLIADLDRKIEVLEGSGEQKRSLSRVSELRDLPCVVLLGEPGSGKSIVLTTEAARRGVEKINVRALIYDADTPRTVLFIDALDEYRSDGKEADKVHGLASAIRKASPASWWLSCRAEDWRKEGDIEAIRAVAGKRPIVVARLLPLDHAQASELLRTFGESDPEAFLHKAQSLGGDAFLYSPLSLRLLHAAVGPEGRWPGTRFELFESAVRRLAYEDNPGRRHERGRPSPEAIIAAADRANLMLLVCGAQALWRSQAMPPESAGDRRAYLAAHDLDIDESLISRALDTALFRGEGETFEPMHRTIAEFTAARALERAVRGESGRAALPLSRALALIADQDGSPPTELRGLFAWFAAHLAKSGDRDGAMRLIEADAPTVMSYGDVAVFDHECKRALFRGLTKRTPYFHGGSGAGGSAAGLACEELAADFDAVLREPLDDTQRMYTVLMALTTGAPVPSLKPLLYEMTLDPVRPDWVRWRAAEAWLNGHPQPAKGRRMLFDALGSEPISEAREEVRLRLIDAEMEPALGLRDIQSMLSAFIKIGRGNRVGRMYALERELEVHPQRELFDSSIRSWLDNSGGPDFRYELDDLLDRALASVIKSTQSLSGNQLWNWVSNASWQEHPSPGPKSRAAIRDWLEADAEREIEIFQAARKVLQTADESHRLVFRYSKATGRFPGPAITRHLLDESLAELDLGRSKEVLSLAFRCINHVDADCALYWETYERLSVMPGMAAMAEDMRVHHIESWRFEEIRLVEDRKKKEEKRMEEEIGKLKKNIGLISNAQDQGALEWGARIYFKKETGAEEGVPYGFHGLIRKYGFDISNAVLAGWKHLLSPEFDWPSATELGRISLNGGYFSFEYAVLAALDCLMDRGELSVADGASARVAISILRQSIYVPFNDCRNRIEDWAVGRLCRDPAIAASDVLEYCQAAVTAGADDLSLIVTLLYRPGLIPVLRDVLPEFLRDHPVMPKRVLRQVLCTAAKCMPLLSLRDLACMALANGAVRGDSRRLWSYVDFATDPAQFDVAGLRLPGRRTVFATFDLALEAGGIINALDFDDADRALRRGMIIFAMGRYIRPNPDFRRARDHVSGNREELVRESINILGASEHDRAAGVLDRLIAKPELEAWRNELRHARFEHARLMRDRAFVPPAPQAVREALAGKAPVNAADLRAIINEELRRLRGELRTAADSPWQQYWDNIGKRGAQPSPKLENICRDYLIGRLRDRLQPYSIALVIPEMQHEGERRSDIALVSHAGKTFPIEIKRDSNAELWVAAQTQLQHYASANTADGSGLYLALWFDHPGSAVPPRPDRSLRPSSATELEAMLVADLPEHLRPRTDVIVFDVSNPEHGSRKKPGGRVRRKNGAVD